MSHKIPFVVSNGIRIGFFILFTAIAFTWTFNIVGWIFIGFVLVVSVFVYRPWRHLSNQHFNLMKLIRTIVHLVLYICYRKQIVLCPIESETGE